MIHIRSNETLVLHEIGDVTRLFFTQPLSTDEKTPVVSDDLVLEHTCHVQGDHALHMACLSAQQKQVCLYQLAWPTDDDSPLAQARALRRGAKTCVYRLLKKYTRQHPPWGGLTGIRPTKLMRQLDEELGTEALADAFLMQEFDVEPQKVRLLRDILATQLGIHGMDVHDSVDVYVGIPFCRTRCAYCSFFGMDIAQGRNLLEPYGEALVREIMDAGELARQVGKHVRAVYVGGGTPTSLGIPILGNILEAIGKAFPKMEEYTVEAGRPDTMDDAMLDLLSSMGVGRISINPQTMHAATLQRIGRQHTPEDVLRVLEAARKRGFDSINMDIILGLPGEGEREMAETLQTMAALPIDNLTVHTLAVKRSSKLHEFPDQYPLPSDDVVSAMIGRAEETARGMGMKPYYLYRQKYMTGNLENVGYAKLDKACLYNIDMMEETHNILACGAGSISKRMFPQQNRHERLPNPKDVMTYLQRLDDLLIEKKAFFRGV